MLTEEGCRRRRQRLWDSLDASVSWALVADPKHVHYFAGFLIDPVSLAAEARAYLWMERSGDAVLVCDNHGRRAAADPPHVDREIVVPWYDGVHGAGQRDRALLPALRELAREAAGRLGALEETAVPVEAARVFQAERWALAEGPETKRSATKGAAPEAKTDLAETIRSLRRRKEPDEVALIRRSVAAGEAGHRRAREVLRPGMSELDLYREVQSAAIAEAGRVAVVYGDFRATRAARPRAGGAPTTEPLQQGDLFILDYSVVISGYRADFTATLAVGGNPSEDQRRLGGTVREALAAGERILVPGVAGAEIHRGISAVFERAGYGPLISHAGHGLGLGHPEPPVLTAESPDRLEPGDVVTLEPGAYVEGVGGVRVEHNYLITGDGFERLTGHALELV